MHFSIISVFPDLYKPFVSTSLIGRAQKKGLVSCGIVDYFSYVQPGERIDSPTCGPGPGMLIRPDVIEKIIDDLDVNQGKSFKIFFSPQGKKLDQMLISELYEKIAQYRHCCLVPARYEGMDERVEAEYADVTLSIGDFVLMGGDLPAMIFLESLLRLIPGVIGNTMSVKNESFSGAFVDYPEYTHPVEWKGRHIPEVVRSGNHAQIAEWRKDMAAKKTIAHHFEWFKGRCTAKNDYVRGMRYVPPHYAALLHDDVLVGSAKEVGRTSVTSIDIHDIARSTRTYNLHGFFIVTPLQDQQAIVKTLLNFWQEGEGCTYNPSRHEAVKRVNLVDSLAAVIHAIAEKEGKSPVILVTSAKSMEDDKKLISFFDQEKVWAHDRPVLLLFGTGQGCAPSVFEQADFVLTPIQAVSDFNHLSVRSAAAIVFDRWLGINEKVKKYC